MANFSPCKLCGSIPVVRYTDISLIAIVCINSECNAPIVLACDVAVGRKLWERRQKGKAGGNGEVLDPLDMRRISPFAGTPRKVNFQEGSK